jgi:hypothetical protein
MVRKEATELAVTSAGKASTVSCSKILDLLHQVRTKVRALEEEVRATTRTLQSRQQHQQSLHHSLPHAVNNLAHQCTRQGRRVSQIGQSVKTMLPSTEPMRVVKTIEIDEAQDVEMADLSVLVAVVLRRQTTPVQVHQ